MEYARDILKTFDNRIHDLRKYGFPFVTGLMTMETYPISCIPSTPSSQASRIPDAAKFRTLIETTLLIISLRWV
jgi:hypothetical protein